MGNSSTKESRGASSRPDGLRSSQPSAQADATNGSEGRHDRPSVSHASRSSRGSRHDLSIFGMGGAGDRDVETRKETRQERDARKLEKERIQRAAERERSLREEGVDGGYLVTLGTYTGPEDFSKIVVRQLMIERRIAPFWRGLNDHSESWTQHQLVAVARGLPIPEPDEIPVDEATNSLAASRIIPAGRSETQGGAAQSRPLPATSMQSPIGMSSSNPAVSRLGTSASNTPSAPTSLFRGRSKTLASITSMRNTSTETQPQEIQLPQDPLINGQPLEAVLYKDAAECPICFLYYPPYLNRTRCCDQPICSECFVQIKRPDPHIPEHADPSAPPAEPKPVEEAEQLVSEPATCPFCVQPEFGVSYDPPPFRRGLAYAAPSRNQPFVKASSAMSSSASLSSSNNGDMAFLMPAAATRRRAQSLSANATNVTTTDKVRPDWAKKLSDARMHAARRAAAATALHTAAFMMGGSAGLGPSVGRRRRGLLGMDGPSGLGRRGSAPLLPEGSSIPNVDVLLAALESSGANRLRSNGERMSSRQTRAQDLEEIMMMEAIRLSLAAEEERRRKSEKEAIKAAKKDDKKKAKEQKKADKVVKKGGLHSPSPSQDGVFASSPERTAIPVLGSNDTDKGKARATDLYQDSSSDANNYATRSNESLTRGTHPQRHLEQSRAMLSASPGRGALESSNQSRLRQFSNASSSDSSYLDSPPGSFKPGFDGSGPAHASGQHLPSTTQAQTQEGASHNGTPGTEPMFNFGSLAAMIGKERVGSIDEMGAQHVEHTPAEVVKPAGSSVEQHAYASTVAGAKEQSQGLHDPLAPSRSGPNPSEYTGEGSGYPIQGSKKPYAY